MAEKRMFTQKIIDSDAFLDMPLSAQALYFHLNMRADDDGFVNNPKKITRYVGAADDDLKILLMKRFVIGFDSGVIVIKHWRMHNTLKSDRYHPTDYQDEFAQLSVKKNKAYTDHPQIASEPPRPLPPSEPNRSQSGSTSEPENRLGSDIDLGLDKDREDKKRKADAFAVFAGDDDELLAALRDFAKMRKSIKKPLTDEAAKRLLSKLQKDFPREDWVAVINQSVDHCWQGLFPLKDGAAQSQRNYGNAAKTQRTAMDDLRDLHAIFEAEEESL